MGVLVRKEPQDSQVLRRAAPDDAIDQSGDGLARDVTHDSWTRDS